MNVLLALLGLFLPTEMTPFLPPKYFNKWNAYSFLYLNPEKDTPLGLLARCPLDGIRVLAANCFSFYSF